MKKKEFALISVYNKTKIEKICDQFQKNDIQIISTGSTANYIKKVGFELGTSYNEKYKMT